MRKTHEITGQSQFFIVKELSIHALYMLLGYLVFVHYYPGHDFRNLFIFLGGFFVFDGIPCSILHGQYYGLNKDTKVILNELGGGITIMDKGSALSFSVDQVANTKLMVGSALYRGKRRGLSAWELYHYAVLEVDGNRQFVITCLLINDLGRFFEELGIKVTKERTLFPCISMARYKKSVGGT